MLAMVTGARLETFRLRRRSQGPRAMRQSRLKACHDGLYALGIMLQATIFVLCTSTRTSECTRSMQQVLPGRRRRTARTYCLYGAYCYCGMQIIADRGLALKARHSRHMPVQD